MGKLAPKRPGRIPDGPLGGVSPTKGARINKESAQDRFNRTRTESAPPAPLGGVDASEKRIGPAAAPVVPKSSTPSGPLGGVGLPGSNVNGGGGSVLAGKTAAEQLKEQQAKARQAAADARAKQTAAQAAQQKPQEPVPAPPADDADQEVAADAEAAEDAPQPPEGASANETAAWHLAQDGADDDDIAESVGVKSSTVARWRKGW